MIEIPGEKGGEGGRKILIETSAKQSVKEQIWTYKLEMLVLMTPTAKNLSTHTSCASHIHTRTPTCARAAEREREEKRERERERDRLHSLG